AQRLAMMLANTSLDAIYSTETIRTQSTAKPTAAAAGMTVQSYSAQELPTFAAQLKRKHRGETVLVVGHSNTTPALASLLDPNEDYPRFSELNYTNLLVVTIPPKGKVRVLKLQF
ncbi:MAG: phosphoglycerate mutase family protein, partial [Saprospiraceae bacterium]